MPDTDTAVRPLRPCWSTGRQPNAVAALPRGRAGWLGGRVMRLGNAGEQREVAALLPGLLADGPAQPDVVDLGCGPGVLTARLARGTRGTLVGVDPSEEMRTLAVRVLARPIARGRLRIADGVADRTGLPDRSADLVVSVNTVAIWPDLDDGVAELHRVLRPGGTVVLSWHGGTRPSRFARSLVLPDDRLDRIEAALAARLTDVRRRLTRRCTVLLATRPPDPGSPASR